MLLFTTGVDAAIAAQWITIWQPASAFSAA
jgi:hypothetical protein